MKTHPSDPQGLLTATTDAAGRRRLRTLPAGETERLLDLLRALPTAEARQDRLIEECRVALSLPALTAWMEEAGREREERRFREFLGDVRRAAERAEAFRELLAGTERLHQVNVALLATRLFDALTARDTAAIESFAHTFAEVVRSAGKAPQD